MTGKRADCNKLDRRTCIIILALLFAMATTPIRVALCFPRATGNLICLVACNGYFIPEESSIMRFRMTRENDGSGEWWLYGEDNLRYYTIMGETGRRYDTILRSEAAKISGFDPLDAETWELRE